MSDIVTVLPNRIRDESKTNTRSTDGGTTSTGKTRTTKAKTPSNSSSNSSSSSSSSGTSASCGVGRKRGATDGETALQPVAKQQKVKCYQALPLVFPSHSHNTIADEKKWFSDTDRNVELQTVLDFLLKYRTHYLAQLNYRCKMHHLAMLREAEIEAKKVLDQYELKMLQRVRQHLRTVDALESDPENYASKQERIDMLMTVMNERDEASAEDLQSFAVMEALGYADMDVFSYVNAREQLLLRLKRLAKVDGLPSPEELAMNAKACSVDYCFGQNKISQKTVAKIIGMVDADMKRHDSEGVPSLWPELNLIGDLEEYAILGVMSGCMRDLGRRD